MNEFIKIGDQVINLNNVIRIDFADFDPDDAYAARLSTADGHLVILTGNSAKALAAYFGNLADQLDRFQSQDVATYEGIEPPTCERRSHNTTH